MLLSLAVTLINAQTSSGRHQLFIQLESESQEIRAVAVSEVLSSPRSADIPRIIRIVEKYLPDSTRQGTVKDNMLLLGKLKSLAAVPLLIRNLTYEVFYKNTKRPQPPQDAFPAVQALIDIGKPSVGPLLDKLKAEDGEKLQLAGSAVLIGILGREEAGALLQAEITHTTDETIKNRLHAVLNSLQKLS